MSFQGFLKFLPIKRVLPVNSHFHSDVILGLLRSSPLKNSLESGEVGLSGKSLNFVTLKQKVGGIKNLKCLKILFFYFDGLPMYIFYIYIK